MEQENSDWLGQFLKGFLSFFRGPMKIHSSLLLERLEKEAFDRFDKDSFDQKLASLSNELGSSHKELLTLYKSLQSRLLPKQQQKENVALEEDGVHNQEAEDFFDALGRFVRYIGSLYLDLHNGSSVNSHKDRFVTIFTQAKSLLVSLKKLYPLDFVCLFGPLGLRDDVYLDLEGRLFSVQETSSLIVECLDVNAMDSYADLSLAITNLNSFLLAAAKARSQTLQITSRLDSLKKLKSMKERELLELESRQAVVEEDSLLDVHLGEGDIKQQLDKIEDDVFLFLVRLRDVLILLADLNSNYDFLAFTTQLEDFQQSSLTFLNQDVLLDVGKKLQEIAERIEFGVLYDVEGAKFSFNDLFLQWQNGDLQELFDLYSSLIEGSQNVSSGVKPITEMTSYESKVGDLKYRINHFSSQENLLLEKQNASRQEEGKFIDRALNVKEEIESSWQESFGYDIEVTLTNV